MNSLTIEVAHGWHLFTERAQRFRADYYALGDPAPTRLFITVTVDEQQPPWLVVAAPLTAIGKLLFSDFVADPTHATVAGCAAGWQRALGRAGAAQGGGVLLSEPEVFKLAATYPEWFPIKDLRELAAVAAEREHDGDDAELHAARADLRTLVALITPAEEEVSDGD